MKLNFVTTRTGVRIAEIDDARITSRNFSGAPDKNNPRGGARSFAVIIPNQDIADKFMNDTNRYGAGWNVFISASDDVDAPPYMCLYVKVGEKPRIRVVSGNKMYEMAPDVMSELDRMNIDHVDLDIRAFDGPDGPKGPYRSAWLNEIVVYLNVSRFDARFAEEEYPEE